jgi:hypothetical protein
VAENPIRKVLCKPGRFRKIMNSAMDMLSLCVWEDTVDVLES